MPTVPLGKSSMTIYPGTQTPKLRRISALKLSAFVSLKGENQGAKAIKQWLHKLNNSHCGLMSVNRACFGPGSLQAAAVFGYMEHQGFVNFMTWVHS